MELPNLQKFYEKHHADKDGLEIIAVNVRAADTPESIKMLWQTNKLTFPAVKDEAGEARIFPKFKGRGCPTNYLLDKDGKVISAWVGFHPQTGADHLKEEFAKAGFK